jgi:hypothetical protein
LHHRRKYKGVEHIVQFQSFWLVGLLGRTAQQGLQGLLINFFSQLCIFDGLEGIGSCLIALSLFGSLLFNLFSIFGSCFFLFEPSGVMLDPDSFFYFPFLLVKDKLINLFRVYLIVFLAPLDLFHFLHFVLALFEDVFSVVAYNIRV